MLHVVVDDLLDDIAGKLDREFVSINGLYDAVAKFWMGNAIADCESTVARGKGLFRRRGGCWCTT